MSKSSQIFFRTLCATAVTMAFVGAAHAAPIAGGVYDGPLTSTDDRWASIGDNTVTVKNGEVHVVGGFGVGVAGNLYLNSDNAVITSDVGASYIYGNIMKDQNTNLVNLKVGSGDFAFDGQFGGSEGVEWTLTGDLTYQGGARLYVTNNAHLNVGGTLTFDSTGSYMFTANDAVITTDRLVTTGYYGLKNGDDGNGAMTEATVNAREIEAAGMLRNMDNGTINVTERVTAGSLWNLGEFEAGTAVIEVTASEDMLPDGTYTDGKSYAFGNGLDKDQTSDATHAASMTVGQLIVHGNAINTTGSALTGQYIKVDETLTNENQANINVSDGTLTANDISGKGGQFKLNNSTMGASASSDFGNVLANQSTVSVGSGNYTIDKFEGTDKTILANDLDATVTISDKSGNMTVATSGTVNDQNASVQDTVDKLSDVVKVEGGDGVEGDTLFVEEGAVNNGYQATFDANGNLINGVETKNQKVEALGAIATLGAVNLRHEMNSLSKRMGELRDSPAGVGTWVRLYGSENEYGAQGITAKNTTIQIGSDVSLGEWKVGVALNYTDGDATYDAGSGDNKTYGFAIYGTWLSESGQFVDLVAKYSRLDQDFALAGMNGSYDNNAFALSAEYGWRFELGSLAFVEPQAAFTYYRIQGDDFSTSNSVKVEQDDYDSYIGRVGVRGGLKFPNNKGTIYTRISYLYDFDGEMHANLHSTAGAGHNTIDEDLGGSWVEFGIGANFNLTDRAYTYVDLEKNTGGEVKENWRWNVGLRYVW